MGDARFEDGAIGPLKLFAMEADSLSIISALTQDSIIPIKEMHYDAKKRSFALLLNRYRWEDESSSKTKPKAKATRAQTVLMVSDITKLSVEGIDRSKKDIILSLLSLTWTSGEDGTGNLTFTFAGDGSIIAEVECLNVMLKDVTQPYLAPSGKSPTHPM